MNEDELIEALDNSDFDNHLDEIMARLDELGNEVDEEISQEQESISEDSELLSELSKEKTQESQTSQVKETQALTLDEENAVKFKNLVALTPTGVDQNYTGSETEKNGYFDPETDRLKVTKEDAKNYKEGQVIEYKLSNGEIQYRILKGIDIISKEEMKAIKTFIALRFAPEVTIAEESKESKKKEEPSYLNKKLAASGGDLKTEKFTYDDKQVESQRAERAEESSEDKSPGQVTLEKNLKELDKELKRKDKKINTEILNHEIQVENIKRNGISVEAKNSDAKATAFRADNIKLNEECREIIHEFLETSTGYEVPQPLKLKFKEIEESFKHIWVSTSNAANHLTPEIMQEIITTKKEILSTIKSMINATGSISKVSVGHDGTTR